MILPGKANLGHILRYVGWPLVLLLAWDVLVTLAYMLLIHNSIDLPDLPIPLIGSAVAVYLTFRNTTAYARWWEARGLWGMLINHSRNFARQCQILLPDSASAVRTNLVQRQIAYAHALRLHLRRQAPWDELAARLPAEELEYLHTIANVPHAILLRSAGIVAREATLFDESRRLSMFDATFGELTNAQGGMERIKNTPLPQQYATYPTILTHALCVLLPVGLVENLHWWTPLGSTATGFLFLALLQIGRDMQNPFENRENDVPLSAMTRTIEIDLRDCLGEAHGLKPLQPEHGVLM